MTTANALGYALWWDATSLAIAVAETRRALDAHADVAFPWTALRSERMPQAGAPGGPAAVGFPGAIRVGDDEEWLRAYA